MGQFNVGPVQYKADPLPVLGNGSALHIARRIAPLMQGLDGFSALDDGKGDGDLMAAMGPLLEALAGLSDDDVDYVLKSCLRVVTRRNDNDTGWSRITVPATGALMFDDINLAVMLTLAANVIRENMTDFFTAARSIFPNFRGAAEDDESSS